MPPVGSGSDDGLQEASSSMTSDFTTLTPGGYSQAGTFSREPNSRLLGRSMQTG